MYPKQFRRLLWIPYFHELFTIRQYKSRPHDNVLYSTKFYHSVLNCCPRSLDKKSWGKVTNKARKNLRNRIINRRYRKGPKLFNLHVPSVLIRKRSFSSDFNRSNSQIMGRSGISLSGLLVLVREGHMWHYRGRDNLVRKYRKLMVRCLLTNTGFSIMI